ncbi:TrkH family potassium uptake protein [Saccharothrix sp. ALI-22-I]|uniref:TrkH family potassium uptake protein n=1 Tax=Saccharothrix sp. ALI-22-I TaxID=1933778 RepID=UPI001EE70F9F|nr:potassium transporter TrkG [Saccharothrix sp. ALI-22-I]
MSTTRPRVTAGVGRPARLIVFGFGCAVLLGTVLLMLPIATENGTSPGVVTALFTATSAVCVTGMVVVDTATHWSTYGEVVILVLVQAGGLGIMTLASLLGLLVARRMGLRMQLTAQAETKTLGLGEVRGVVLRVIAISLVVEAVTAIALSARFAIGYDMPFGRAVYEGVFHGVSAFNNSGFALYATNMVPYATDPWIIVPIMIAIIIGGLGFPVLFEIGRRLRGKLRRWSLHARITLLTYAALTAFGIIALTAIEWSNPATLGPLGVPGKLLVGAFHGVNPRSAGFNSVDVAQMSPASLLVTDFLMFVGGGSASTAGGIKVTTFALLAFVIVAEIRGEPSVHVMGRRLSAEVQRQALTVALLGVGAVATSTFVLLLITDFPLDLVLFEATSAFGTVGMSTGIPASFPVGAQVVLVVLMFVGRLGPITLGAALALRERARRYELPEERPIVG